MKKAPLFCWNAIPLIAVAAIYIPSGVKAGYYALGGAVLAGVICLILRVKTATASEVMAPSKQLPHFCWSASLALVFGVIYVITKNPAAYWFLGGAVLLGAACLYYRSKPKR